MLITFIVGLSQFRSQYSPLRYTSQKEPGFPRAIIQESEGCWRGNLDSLALARQITDWAAEAKAEDIVLLDVRKATYLADYFVICSATSERQMTALAERIRDKSDEEGVPLFHQEGTADSGWVLLDYGDVIVHIFSAALRSFYHLERVWGEATVVVRVM
ncbi:MAG TPA: ribosome silencing factor [Chloroflexota bacterium]|nr:ribosome silencing factor [Chloroflexota bacterium]